MPELPEVETVAAVLRKAVVGKTIASITVLREKNIETDPHSFVSSLQGKTIEGIGRRGKYLVFLFDDDFIMLSHLRMEGRYEYRHSDDPRNKHDILYFHFTDGTYLAYVDTRKFGRLGLYPDEMHSPLHALGPEPFDLDADSFYEILRKERRPIKAVLLDQTVLAGVGNIYADESLALSHIHPLTNVTSIDKNQCSRLLSNLIKILQEAIEMGGSTVRSFHSGEASGRMQLHLRAYGKKGSPCPFCGAKLKTVKVATRTSTYCPFCQKRADEPFVLGVTGPVHSGKSTASKYFQSQGYALFDCDAEIHHLYDLFSIQAKIKALFGENSYIDGRLNSKKILASVSADSLLKKKLEGILYPALKARLRRFLASFKAGDKVVLEVPLLFPSKIDSYCSATMLVLADKESRAKRLQDEGKDADAYLSLNDNYPLEEAKKKADIIVFNDSDLPSFLETLSRYQ